MFQGCIHTYRVVAYKVVECLPVAITWTPKSGLSIIRIIFFVVLFVVNVAIVMSIINTCPQVQLGFLDVLRPGEVH
jgi:hypothetical protein